MSFHCTRFFLILLNILISEGAGGKSERKPVFPKGKVVKFSELTKDHFPISMNLSPPEIKLFAGHALNLLRSKCQNVDSAKIHLIQRHISLQATRNILHADDHRRKMFSALLSSMRVCVANTPVLPKTQHHFVWLRYKLEEFGLARVLSGAGVLLDFVRETFMKGWKIVKAKLKLDAENDRKSLPKVVSDVFKPYSPDRIGEAEFYRFVSGLEELYTRSCAKSIKGSGSAVFLFKAAARDLFNYLTVDRIRTEKAAAYYLTSDFLESIYVCIEALQ